MGGVLSQLRQDTETKSLYYFFRKCFIVLRNPPLKLDIRKTKELLFKVLDEDEIDDILPEINALLSIKQNYEFFVSHPAITRLMECFRKSESNLNHLTIGHMAALEGDTFLMDKLLTYEIIPEFTTTKDNTGKTPLHHASKSGNNKIIDQLLNTAASKIEEIYQYAR